MGVSVLIRRITLAALVAALAGGTLALPASSKTGPLASASKCKKSKKGRSKRKKKCGSGRPSQATLPGQATHPTATPPSPPVVRGVSGIGVTDNPVLAGQSTSGQLTISGPAPTGGQPVSLQSSDGSVSVPASVVVPAGQTAASFTVGTTGGSATTATLTASIGASNANVLLNVVSTPSVASVGLERQCFTAGSYGSNRVTLDVAAPSDTSVSLLSSDSAVFTVPSTVTVPTGSKSAFFSALAAPPVTPATATVTATLGTSSKFDTASVTATPDQSVSDLSFSSSNVTVGDSPIGTVTLTCEAASDTHVTLHSDFAGVTVPPEVLVPAGELSATFTANTNAVGTANVSADSGTGGPQTTPLQVDSQPD